MKYTPLFLVLAGILVVCCRRGPKDPRPEGPQAAAQDLEIQVYPTSGSGYGYAIYRDKKKIIDQPHIPAVQHLQSFATEEEARCVAGLVRQKLEAKFSLPTVSLQELDSLHVGYH
jgi:hypothetical protein